MILSFTKEQSFYNSTEVTLFPFTFSKMCQDTCGIDYLEFYNIVLTEQLGKFPDGTTFPSALLNAKTGLLSFFDNLDIKGRVYIKAHAESV